MLVVNREPRSISAESYRALRTSIKFSSADKELKTIVITSSIPQEGKSTIAGNLAYSLSQDGKNVLVIDCDLRKPSLHRRFGVSNEKGITDFLINKCGISEVINEIDEKLSIITCGTIPPNPAEIIGSHTMENFLGEVALIFDHIIIDTPPILAVTDAQLLAAKADATIMVVRAKVTKGKYIRQSYKELTKVNANVIGSVLNDSSEKTTDMIYQYYGENEQSKKAIFRFWKNKSKRKRRKRKTKKT